MLSVSMALRAGSIVVAATLIGFMAMAHPVMANGPTAPIPAPNPPRGYVLVLDLSFHAISDEDSGCVGY